MKRFSFKLETVLNVKHRIKDQRQQELSQAESLRDEALMQLQYYQAELAATTANYRRELQARLNLVKAIGYQKYLAWQEMQVEQAVQLVNRRDREVEEARQRLIVIIQECQVVEKLKEKAYQEYLAEEKRLDLNFLDELGAGRFIRQAK